MSIETKENKKENLIIVDLDGTLLDKTFSKLNPENKEVLHKLKEKHKVCIATGRNYLSALPFYQEIGLNTPLITYNGAFANYPLEEDIPPLKFVRISNLVIRSILSEEAIRENLLNVLVDTVDRKTISTTEDIYYQQIFFNGNPYVKVDRDILKHLENKDCLQLVLEFPFYQGPEAKKNDLIISALKKYRGKSISYDFGKKLKAEKEESLILVPDSTKWIFKIRNVLADKFEAVKSVAAHYHISLDDTIAFGNDTNDIKMLSNVGLGVAVSNSDINLKVITHDITELDSHSGGVAKYLAKHFGL